jgi:hypothetical protein
VDRVLHPDRWMDGWMDHGCDWLIRISVRVCVSASFAKF